jgi:3-hydroxyacyl-CoA dehydrogenase
MGYSTVVADGADTVGGGVIGVVITALVAAVIALWTKRHDLRREDRKDAAEEWRSLVDKLKASLEETERRFRESGDAMAKKLEGREAELGKCQVEMARLTERLSLYERKEGGCQ